jgi:hypothetical protein
MRAEQAREQHINRIGNLTLATEALNPSMGHDPWASKRAALRRDSKLELNAEIAGSAAWNEAQIDLRAQRLAMLACEVWKRPADVKDTQGED